MHDLPTGPGGNHTPISVPTRAPYDSIERGSFLLGEKIDTYSIGKVPEIEFTSGIENDIAIPVSPRGLPMTPIERSTGTPLPILCSESSPRHAQKPNEHHAYFFSEWYTKELSTAALRLSRIQSVDRGDHARYHQRFIGTLPLRSEQDTFAAVIRNCAGYVPNYGVSVEEDRTLIRPLRNHEKQALRATGTFYPENHADDEHSTAPQIGRFLLGYALKHNHEAVDLDEVREFLSIPRQSEKGSGLKEEKFELGMRIARRLFESAVNTLQAEFEQHGTDNSFMENPLNACPVTVAESQVKHFKRATIKNLHLTLQERAAI